MKLSIGSAVYHPGRPDRKVLLTALAMFAEFESDLARMRTREGMPSPGPKGRLRGEKPKLTARQEQHLVQLHTAGEHTRAELAELFGVAGSTRVPSKSSVLESRSAEKG